MLGQQRKNNRAGKSKHPLEAAARWDNGQMGNEAYGCPGTSA